MSFTSSLPTKLLIFGAKRVVLIELTDTVRVSDRISKVTYKKFTDIVKCNDYFRKVSMKVLRDQAKSSDYIRKTQVKIFQDTCRVSDRIQKSIYSVFRDVLIGEFSLASFRAKELRDTVKTIDSISKAGRFVRVMLDTGKVSDKISKSTRKSLKDTAKSSDRLSKTAGKKLIDLCKASDRIQDVETFIRVLTDMFKGFDYIRKAVMKVSSDQTKATDYIKKSPIKSLKDTGRFSDYIKKTTYKRLFDTIESRDKISKIALKCILDPIRSMDTFQTTKYFSRSFADVAKVSDTVSKVISKKIVDTAVGEYYLALVKGKELKDIVKVMDYYSKSIAKVCRESLKMSDYLEPSSFFIRSITDYCKVEDYYARAISIRRDLTDQVKVSDKLKKDIVKILTDTIRVSEQYRKIIEKVLIDSIIASDYIAKQSIFVRTFLDTFVDEGTVTRGYVKTVSEMVKASDLISRTLIKNMILTDLVRAADLCQKSILKAILDTSKALDYIGRQSSFVRELRDTFIGEYTIAKVPVKMFYDAAKVSDTISKALLKVIVLTDTAKVLDAYSKIVTKAVLDLGKLLDYIHISRGFVITLRDTFVDEGGLLKTQAKTLVDKAVLRDLVTKIGYTLTGISVRRVYTLSGELKELTDTILPEDHNQRVDASKNLLELFKDTRDLLGIDDPDINEMINNLENIVSKMRYVKFDDEAKAEDVNVFVDYCNIAVDLAEELYEIFISKTGKELPDVEIWLTIARSNVGFMSKAASLKPFKPVYHNLPIDCMKCLELSLKKIQENL